MSKENAVKIFEERQVRTYWNEKKELWYISVIDVVEVLTGTDRPRKYWNDLKTKLKKEGSELSEKIGQLNMLAEASTKDISQATNPKTFKENAKVAKQGGNVAKVARLELEAKIGKKVITPLNAKTALKEKGIKQIRNKKPKDK